jgi:LPS sulfotransferase NodH
MVNLIILCANERTGSTFLEQTLLKWCVPNLRGFIAGNVACKNRCKLKNILINSEKSDIWWLHVFHNTNGFRYLKCLMQEVDNNREFNFNKLLNKYFSVKYIHLVRRDKLRQAISLLKARQTDQFRFNVPKKNEPYYDIVELEKTLKEIVRLDHQWEIFFERISIQPYRIYYEDMVIDIEDTGFRIADYLGIQKPKPPYIPYLQRQSDSTNVEWASKWISGYGWIDEILHGDLSNVN